MRVVFDVNILIRAALGSPQAARILGRCAEPDFSILTSQLLLRELSACSRKPRLTDRIDRILYDNIVTLLAACGEPVQITPPFPACRDPDDAYLLAMAQVGQADYLVSLDQDLLCLEKIGGCRIVTPDDFESVLGDL